MTSPRNASGSRGFVAFGLAGTLVSAVTSLGYEEPTPVQCETIPLLLSGRDMLAQAATGTGKTAAFALPMLHHLLTNPPSGRRRTRGLVLVPTRELAMQVADAIHRYARSSGLFVVPVYGGASMSMQIRALSRGADIVVDVSSYWSVGRPVSSRNGSGASADRSIAKFTARRRRVSSNGGRFLLKVR